MPSLDELKMSQDDDHKSNEIETAKPILQKYDSPEQEILVHHQSTENISRERSHTDDLQQDPIVGTSVKILVQKDNEETNFTVGKSNNLVKDKDSLDSSNNDINP